jgi:hypothetical protein
MQDECLFTPVLPNLPPLPPWEPPKNDEEGNADCKRVLFFKIGGHFGGAPALYMLYKTLQTGGFVWTTDITKADLVTTNQVWISN